MIWFIISVIITMAILIYVWRENWDYGMGDCIVGSVLTLVLSGLITVAVILFSSLIISADESVFEYNKSSDTAIIALNDNQNLSGRFYITGGYVNEELYYYYAVDSTFGYKTEKVKADSSYIKYTDEKPHIETYVADFANDSTYLWGFPICGTKYIIYCPDGTITSEFNIDLE